MHYSTFLAFALALAHGIGAGTDTEAPWAQYLYAGSGLLAFNLLVYRVLKGESRAGPEPERFLPDRGAAAQPGTRRLRA
jgi:hypothetical protein